MLGTSKNSQTEGLEKMVSEWMSQLGDRIGADRMVDVAALQVVEGAHPLIVGFLSGGR